MKDEKLPDAMTAALREITTTATELEAVVRNLGEGTATLIQARALLELEKIRGLLKKSREGLSVQTLFKVG